MGTGVTHKISQLVSFIEFTSAVETLNLPLGPGIVDSIQRKLFYFINPVSLYL